MSPRRARQLLFFGGAVLVVVAVTLAAVVWVTRGDQSRPPTDLERLGRYGAVPPFALTERSGRRVTLDDLRGSVWVVDFIYTECTESCPTQSLQFAQLQRDFATEPRLRLVSVTVDPAHDTQAVLARYAERYGAGDRWWFLTGDKRAIYCLARDGFRLGVVDSRAAAPVDCGGLSWLTPGAAWASHGSQGLIMHSARIVLVDREGQIRAYHLATDGDSVTALRANLETLLREAARGERR